MAKFQFAHSLYPIMAAPFQCIFFIRKVHLIKSNRKKNSWRKNNVRFSFYFCWCCVVLSVQTNFLYLKRFCCLLWAFQLINDDENVLKLEKKSEAILSFNHGVLVNVEMHSKILKDHMKIRRPKCYDGR